LNKIGAISLVNVTFPVVDFLLSLAWLAGKANRNRPATRAAGIIEEINNLRTTSKLLSKKSGSLGVGESRRSFF
jgi:hypothetical protein